MSCYPAGCLSFLWGVERVPVTDHLSSIDQKMPDWSITIMFLGEAETAIRSSVKSKFALMTFSTSAAFCSLWFSPYDHNHLPPLDFLCHQQLC